MNVNRHLLGTLAVVLAVAAGCGGSETDGAAATGAAAKGGGASTTPTVTMTEAPNPADRSANVTIDLYPGSYAGQKLFIKWQCYQGGQMLAHDGSYDLAAAASQGFAGYAWVIDHYEWTFVPSQSYNFALSAGPASCDMQAWYANRKGQWFQIGSGTFGML